MRRPALITLVVGVVVALGAGMTGCGSDAPAPYNEADVTFASEMVSHHEQAVEMAEMVAARPSAAPGLTPLAAAIRDEQGSEIDRMCSWLEDWDKPAPDPDADTDMDMGGEMEGMMSHEQMTALEETPDADFERAWLELMLAHHQGALEMARTEVSTGRYPAAVDLARDIEVTQTSEIARMQSLLTAAG